MNSKKQKSLTGQEAQGEKKKRGLRVELKTKANGYLLEVDDEGYMYFTPEQMVEGFIVHVGMKRLDALTSEDAQMLIHELVDGTLAKRLQAEVTELKAQVREQTREIKKLKKNQEEK